MNVRTVEEKGERGWLKTVERRCEEDVRVLGDPTALSRLVCPVALISGPKCLL
jgi:hypothetical protein